MTKTDKSKKDTQPKSTQKSKKVSPQSKVITKPEDKRTSAQKRAATIAARKERLQKQDEQSLEQIDQLSLIVSDFQQDKMEVEQDNQPQIVQNDAMIVNPVNPVVASQVIEPEQQPAQAAPQVVKQEDVQMQGGEQDSNKNISPELQKFIDNIPSEKSYQPVCTTQSQKGRKAKPNAKSVILDEEGNPVKPDPKPRVKKPTNLKEVSDGTVSLDNNSTIKKQPAVQDENATMLEFWKAQTTQQQETQGPEHLFLNTITEVAKHAVVTGDKAQLETLKTSFKAILQQKFSIWFALPDKEKPSFFAGLTTKQVCETILEIVKANQSIDTPTLGRYAAEIIRQCSRPNFDGQVLDNRFELVDNKQVATLVNMVLQETVKYDDDNLRYYAEYRAGLCWLLIKWGQANKLLKHCYDNNGTWNTAFQQNNKNFNQNASQKANNSTSEYKIGCAIFKVYGSIAYEVVMKLFAEQYYKLIGNHYVLTTVSQLNKARQNIYVEIILVCLASGDISKTLWQLARIDSEAPWLLNRFNATLKKHPQRFQDEDLIKFLDQLVSMNEVNALAKLDSMKADTDMNDQLFQMEQGMVVAETVDTKAVLQYVAKQIQNKQDISEYMDKIETLCSQHVEQNRSGFQLDKYQQYMASIIMHKGNLVYSQIPSGSGKTIVMLFVALACKYLLGLENVCFITSSQLLMNQLKKEIYQICPYVPFDYGNTENADKISQAGVYIVDEADECLNKLVTFDSATYKMNGLVNMLGATRLYFFSASMTQIIKSILDSTFTRQNPQIAFKKFEAVVFESQYQISTRARFPYKIECFNYNNNADVEKDFLNCILTSDPKKSIIIFLEDQNQLLVDQIKINVEKVFGTGRFHTIADENELTSKGPLLQTQPTGAVLLPHEFARGINVRFKNDSIVFVLGNAAGIETKLRWPIVTQMVGRSSRRFGLCTGKVFIKTQVQTANKEEGGELFLQRVGGGVAEDEGHHIARALFAKFPAIKSKAIRKEIMDAVLQHPGWRTTVDSFRQLPYKAPYNIYKFIRIDTFKPVDDWPKE